MNAINHEGPLLVEDTYEDSRHARAAGEMVREAIARSEETNSWEIVETRVLRKCMARVSVLWVPHGAPRYSIRIGSAQLTREGQVQMSNHVSVYDAEDAAALVSELGAEYLEVRNSQKHRRSL